MADRDDAGRFQPGHNLPGPGRPSAYDPSMNDQARKLALLGLTDEGIALFFDMSIADLARVAWEHEAFFNAITPSAEEVAAYRAPAEKRRARRREYLAKRRASNPQQRMKEATGSRIWAALNGKTDGRLFSRLGYTRAELVAHLEAKFRDGMTWANYGTWHVDHIRPCASFDLSCPDQFAACWALGNLQPLWASENMRKGARHAIDAQ